VVEKIRGFQQVEEVFYGKSWVEKLESISEVVKLAGSGVTGFLFLSVALVITVKIRHALAARQDEVEICKILGAMQLFIRAVPQNCLQHLRPSPGSDLDGFMAAAFIGIDGFMPC